jgi:hypothetical protein
MGLDAAIRGTSGHNIQKDASIEPAAQVARSARAGIGADTAVFANRYNGGQIPPAPGSFSIFWITDTQFLSEANPGLFRSMNRWILSNWAAYNGKLVIHTGDLVQDGSKAEQWKKAGEAMSVFLQNGVPYTWCAGNHDDLVLGDQFSGWIGNQWGAPALDPETVGRHVNGNSYPTGNETAVSHAIAAGSAQWIGDFNNGMDTALRFTANGLNFLVINLEWNATQPVLQWAESILDTPQFSDHNAILAPHAYVNASGQSYDPSQGPVMATFSEGFVSLLDAHPNVFLTLSGHFATDSGYYTPSPVRGRNQLMFDRQDRCDYANKEVEDDADASGVTQPDRFKVGGATVTILNFDTVENLIHVSTYDVYTGHWRVDYGNQYSVVMFANPPLQRSRSDHAPAISGLPA